MERLTTSATSTEVAGGAPLASGVLAWTWIAPMTPTILISTTIADETAMEIFFRLNDDVDMMVLVSGFNEETMWSSTINLHVELVRKHYCWQVSGHGYSPSLMSDSGSLGNSRMQAAMQKGSQIAQGWRMMQQ